MNKKIEVNEATFITLVEDIKEIKGCLKGDQYHKEGYVQKVDKNTECIQEMKRKQTGFFAIIGGAWTVFTVGLALLIANIKN